ncbi:MAG: phosphohydrolase [Spirochaetae bacterium HGW-Spirochaetae-3]|jgi:HD-GYP domain-containing protein (c-di-GMP phosphodiesterase class II)|nr:MAG: phosphohydrolase [Spirochaetae bacterium HGW-Spirochaetae-3]
MLSEASEVQQIIQIDSELNKIRDYDILLERVLLEARRVVHADAGSIYVKEGDVISIKFAHNDTKQKSLPPGEKQAYPHFSIPINDQSISGYVAMTGELLNIPDVYNLPEGLPFSYATAYDAKVNYKTTSMLTVPLKSQNNVVLGVIQIINAMGPDGEVEAFTKQDESLVTHFAANATVALQRAYMTRAMIIRMIRMAELRDPKETGAHVNRVAGYAVEIYERWAYKHGVEKDELDKNKDLLKLAAMLHDVGKVAISDLILKKPARFTPEEYVIMQTHTCSGARLFDDPQSDFDTIAAEVSLTHHENWDGTGYPGWVDPVSGEVLRKDAEGRPVKRKGGEIPLWGRIVAIADVYDALMSRRVYKEAWDEDAVLAEIRSCSGTKFDPELIEAFFDVLPRIHDIRERHPDEE